MLRTELASLVNAAVADLIREGSLPANPDYDTAEIADTKSAEHGDYACNFALTSAKKAGMPPRTIGELLKGKLQEQAIFDSVEVAGPGFVNMRLKPSSIAKYLRSILQLGVTLPNSSEGAKTKVNVEFVSVNPNGPITVGSGRGAAFGDTLCRVLKSAGFNPSREYYINDGVNSLQMRLFADSVKHHYLALRGLNSEFPENGYKGDYVEEVAHEIEDGHEHESTEWFQKLSQARMLERQKIDLESFRVHFDTWFSEQSMHDEGKVTEALEILVSKGNAYRSSRALSEPVAEEVADEFEEGDEAPAEAEVGEALWIRSSQFGDDKDRVLVRANGRPTYIAPDVAYLQNKFDRGFEKLKLILGPDHHGYIGRIYAACRALGHTAGPEGEFEIVIYQAVRFVKDGKPARMRKRDGNIYSLRDLIDELGTTAAPNGPLEEQRRIGADVARFFFLMRSHDTHMDFDIDLATKQSDENPVFYAQYAHARICSVLERSEAAGFWPAEFDENVLKHERELALLKKIMELPLEVGRAAKDYGVHRLATYAVELGRTFHHFYDACRVVQPDEPALSTARSALCEATKLALASTFDLIGVSAPTRMESASKT